MRYKVGLINNLGIFYYIYISNNEIISPLIRLINLGISSRQTVGIIYLRKQNGIQQAAVRINYTLFTNNSLYLHVE